MTNPDQQSPPAPNSQPTLFAGPPPEPSGRGKLIIAAAIACVVVLVASLFYLRGSHTAAPAAPNAILQADPYAKNLSFTQLAMSQSTSLSGGTSTFIDGHIKNSGPDTVTGVTMQVFFRNDVDLGAPGRDRAFNTHSSPRALRRHRTGQRRSSQARRRSRIPPHL